MGKDKLALPFRGSTVLATSSAAASALPFHERLLVVTEGRRETPPGFTPVVIPADGPMHASIKAGIRALATETKAVMITLADQPFLEPGDYHAILRAWRDALATGRDLLQPVNATGGRGHPVIVHSRYFPEILAHPDDDRGCYYLFARHADRAAFWPTENPAYFRDLDSPEDYAHA